MSPPLIDAYTELLQQLFTARRFGVVLGLSRMRELLDRLGAPDRRLGRVVHVAGTNGKGSTVAMIAALVRESGARVATYTSPHLSSIRERIMIDGAPVTRDAFVAAGAQVSAVGGDALTFFEQLTAIAMVAIADADVELTVLEVGLGGRLDATNVIDPDVTPVAVITGVAMDHEAILGTTLAAIAREKAGIIKRGQHVVIGASGEPTAVPMLVAAARAAGATFDVIDAAMVTVVPPVALPGDHQRANAAAAIAAIDALGITLDGDARARALAAVTHPGRFEALRDRLLVHDDRAVRLGMVILDGAHNPHGAVALATELIARQLRPTLVLAVSADKDVRAIARALLPAVDGVIATCYAQERALPPDDLAAVLHEVTTTLGLNIPISSAGGLAAALAAAAGAGAILVAGSLFLVGEARSLLLGAPTDPFVVTDPAATKNP